eukprot:GDKJ01025773.1.p1 GENE.GDKJ01025773.1~~GDKJ01025773.1.p1  ORF type:complete len:174 (-),score=14.45 GDKJ01025773.1:60-581(-)
MLINSPNRDQPAGHISDYPRGRSGEFIPFGYIINQRIPTPDHYSPVKPSPQRHNLRRELYHDDALHKFVNQFNPDFSPASPSKVPPKEPAESPQKLYDSYIDKINRFNDKSIAGKGTEVYRDPYGRPMSMVNIVNWSHIPGTSLPVLGFASIKNSAREQLTPKTHGTVIGSLY